MRFTPSHHSSRSSPADAASPPALLASLAHTPPTPVAAPSCRSHPCLPARRPPCRARPTITSDHRVTAPSSASGRGLPAALSTVAPSFSSTPAAHRPHLRSFICDPTVSVALNTDDMLCRVSRTFTQLPVFLFNLLFEIRTQSWVPSFHTARQTYTSCDTHRRPYRAQMVRRCVEHRHRDSFISV